jgi:hypothetical protein
MLLWWMISSTPLRITVIYLNQSESPFNKSAGHAGMNFIESEHLLLESLPNIVLLFTYIVVLIALGLQAEELFFLLPVVEGTDCGHDKHSHENGKALDPRYLI